MNRSNTLYVSTTFMRDRSRLKDALDACVDIGVVNVEIGSNHRYEEDYDYITDYPFGYLIHNYFPIPKVSFVLNIASSNSEIRARSIRHVKRALDMSSAIKAELYTFHPGFVTDPTGSNTSDKNYDFLWDDEKLHNSSVGRSTDLMYIGIEEIISYAKKLGVRIAIETEGSMNRSNHVLMQTPTEYGAFIDNFRADEIGINLNIGHLNLAANMFGFDKGSFVNVIQDYIVAMELSHNDGNEDQHLPLQLGQWYWDILKDARFIEVPKIVEVRNLAPADVKSNVELICRELDCV